MTCKEKYGYTPEEILNMEYGLRDGKSMTHLEMKMEAIKEIEELKSLKSCKVFSQSYEQIKNNRIKKLEETKTIFIYSGDEMVNLNKN